MSEGIKEVLINKAFDEFCNLVIGKSKEELKEFITNDDLKKILFNTMKNFSESKYFVDELKEYKFIEDKKIIKDFDEKMINPSLPIVELKNNISPIIDRYFVSDYNDGKDIILSAVTKSYRNAASLKITLYDLLKRQEQFYKETDKKLDSHTDMLTEIINKQKNEEDYKKNIMKNTIGDMLIAQLNIMAQTYINFITKEPCVLKNMDPTKGRIQFKNMIIENMENINMYINKDFYKKPVYINTTTPETIFNFKMERKEVANDIYCSNFFKFPSIKIINNIINEYSHNITNDFNSNLLQLKNDLNSSFFLTGIEFNMKIELGDASFNLESLKAVIKRIGDSLVKLYECLE